MTQWTYQGLLGQAVTKNRKGLGDELSRSLEEPVLWPELHRKHKP